jgi:PAS domain S-box-containing protein
MFKGVTLKDVLAAIGIFLVIATFLKEFFGVSVIGKKIYKGAPLLWKWIMRNATFTKEVLNRLEEMNTDIKQVKVQVEYNGGASIKDAVRRIEQRQERLYSMIELNNIRLDIHDESNDRMSFRMDSGGAIVFINDAFLKFFGYSEKDVMGFAWESIVNGEDLRHVQEKWERTIEKQSRFYDEHGLCDVDGKCHDCIVRAYPICEGSVLKGFYGTVDIKK